MAKKFISAVCFIVITMLIGLTVCAQDDTNPEIVYVSSLEDFASAHPYEGDTYAMWIYKGSESAKTITVVFSEQTYTEDGFDTITIFDSDGIMEISGLSVPDNTTAIKLMVVDSNNLRPLRSAKTYEIKG